MQSGSAGAKHHSRASLVLPQASHHRCKIAKVVQEMCSWALGTAVAMMTQLHQGVAQRGRLSSGQV